MSSSHDTSLTMKTKDGVHFGKELREKEFLFDKDFLNLNHGSFGTYPRIIRTTMRSYQDAAEARPDHFIRYQYPTHIDASREAMAKFLNTPSSTLVFVPNATTGVNTVLRNLTFESGDHILYFDTIYGACEKTVSYITETTPAQATKIQYTYPVEDDWLVDEFRKAVKSVQEKGGKARIAIFDTVVSMPGVRMPFERLSATCNALDVMSCIDAAHGVGNVEIDLATLDPDFFVSNCHKWLYVPRGCAIFHVPARNQHLIRSTVPTSHGFEPRDLQIASPFSKSAFADASKSKYISNFEFVGTLDNAPYLCIPDAIKWRERLGGEAVIREYNWKLAQEGARHIADVLGTEVLDNKTQTLTQCCMANLRLPIDPEKARAIALESGIEMDDVGFAVRDWMNRTMIDDYGTFIQTLFYGGVWWARVSGQVYLEMSDFHWAAETLTKICERIERGEWAVVKGKL